METKDESEEPHGFRFFPEYASDTVFWSDREGHTPIECLPLSVGLCDELRAWISTFEREFRHDSGWTNDDVGREFNERGAELCARAQQELGTGYLLRLELWT
jgi:hypothetical protein